MAQKHDFFSSLLYVRYWVHVFMHMNEGGVMRRGLQQLTHPLIKAPVIARDQKLAVKSS